MIKLMKYDYESFPEEWKSKNENIFNGIVFAYLGEIKKIPGHGYFQDVRNGKPYIIDIDSMKELTENEL